MGKPILLVKTSSLGDVVHALPVINDMRSCAAVTTVDWVVEDIFAGVLRLHSGVSRVLEVAVRRWRRALLNPDCRLEFSAFVAALREKRYEAIIDAQGLLKSALIARAARGLRYGLDWRSSREPLRFLYHRTFAVPWGVHAVERNRLLAARVLGYEVPVGCDYGISAPVRAFDWLPPGHYAVLLHATSGDYKLWSEAHWIELGRRLDECGMRCVLAWGSPAERDRASRIADHMRCVVIAPALDIGELAGLLAGAKAVVGADTGLTHLAGALGVPTVGVYCGTDPGATGLYGCARAASLGGVGRPPQPAEVMGALATLWS